MYVCPRCGALVAPGRTICRACSTRLDASELIPRDAVPTDVPTNGAGSAEQRHSPLGSPVSSGNPPELRESHHRHRRHRHRPWWHPQKLRERWTLSQRRAGPWIAAVAAVLIVVAGLLASCAGAATGS